MNQPAQETPKKEAVKVNPKLTASRFQGAEFARHLFRATPAASHDVRDTLHPEYFSTFANQIALTDKIEAVWDDNSKYAEYLVIDKGPNWVKVKLLVLVDLSKAPSVAAPDPAESDYEVLFLNNHEKHCVIRKSDNKAIKRHLATKQEAEAFLADYLKKIA